MVDIRFIVLAVLTLVDVRVGELRPHQLGVGAVRQPAIVSLTTAGENGLVAPIGA